MSLIRPLLHRHRDAILADPELSGLHTVYMLLEGINDYNAGDLNAAWDKLSTLVIKVVYPYLDVMGHKVGSIEDRAQVYRTFLRGNTSDLYIAHLQFESKGVAAYLRQDNQQITDVVSQFFCDTNSLRGWYLKLQGNNAIRDVWFDHLIQTEDFETL